MIRHISLCIFVLIACLFCLFVKLKIPLSYATAPIRSDAIAFTRELQTKSILDPAECAVQYLFYQTDYHSKPPAWIEVSSNAMPNGEIRVRVHNPKCQDDSVTEHIDRLYMHMDENQQWIPIKHEWSHTGRGKFGWTTEPTN